MSAGAGPAHGDGPLERSIDALPLPSYAPATAGAVPTIKPWQQRIDESGQRECEGLAIEMMEAEIKEWRAAAALASRQPVEAAAPAAGAAVQMPSPLLYYRADENGDIVWGEDCVCVDDVYSTGTSGEADESGYSGRKAFSEQQVEEIANARAEEARREAAAKLERAERALKRAGFTDQGGAEWKPPIGPQPRFIEVPVQRTAGGDAVPYGWVQFIDGTQTQNFARDEAELKTIKDMFRIMKYPGKAEYVPVFAAQPVEEAAAQADGGSFISLPFGGPAITNMGKAPQNFGKFLFTSGLNLEEDQHRYWADSKDESRAALPPAPEGWAWRRAGDDLIDFVHVIERGTGTFKVLLYRDSLVRRVGDRLEIRPTYRKPDETLIDVIGSNPDAADGLADGWIFGGFIITHDAFGNTLGTGKTSRYDIVKEGHQTRHVFYDISPPNDELLPCPFCNGDPTLEDHRTIWTVTCKCGACVLGDRAPEPDSTEDDEYWAGIRSTAVAAWNRRAALRQPGALGDRK